MITNSSSGIDHTKTKTMSPQTNGICEQFDKAILNEFYQVAFRNKLIKRWRRGKMIRMSGCLTTMNELIRAKCATAERQLKLGHFFAPKQILEQLFKIYFTKVALGLYAVWCAS